MAIPTLLTLFLFILANRPIRRIHFISLTDLLRNHYGDATAVPAKVLIFLYMVLLSASQFTALGEFAGAFLRGGYPVAVCAGVLVVTAYSWSGGYLSVVFTDFFQLLLMFIGFAAVLCFLIPQATLPPLPALASGFSSTLDQHLLITLSFTLAWFISPIVWQRITSARSERASLWGLLLSVLAIILLYVMVLAIGLLAPGFSGKFSYGDFIRQRLPTIVAIPALLGVVSAILSTAATAINLAALTAVSGKQHQGASTSLLPAARLATLVSGILAALVALRLKSILIILGASSEIMAEGFFIPGMAALFFGIRSPRAGLFSICLGGGFALISSLQALFPIGLLPPWPASLPWGLLCSGSGFLAGALLDHRREMKEKA
jgi:SSS family solute:Na+ symporter